MKQNIKKIVPVFSIIAVLALSNTSVFAKYSNNENTTEISIENLNNETTISFESKPIEGAKIIKSDSKVMVSLRTIAEFIGYKVNWNNESKTIELENDSKIISFKNETDNYTITEKTSDKTTKSIQLGNIAENKDGVTYVPIEFLNKVLYLNIEETENNSINLFYAHTETEAENEIGKAEIKSIDESEILVNDEEKGEVRLNISSDTQIENENGDKLTLKDLKQGDKLTVTYGLAMTFSIPPMNNPIKIVLNSNDKNNNPENSKTGNAEFMEDIKDNKVLINDTELGEVILNISDDTEILDKDGNKTDAKSIKKGVNAKITYGEIMTSSLPPINNPVKIEIQNNNPTDEIIKEPSELSIKMTGKIIEINEKSHLVTIENEDKKPYDMVSLLITENTKITDSENNTLKFDDLEENQELSASFSSKMTRSIPPQTEAIEIQVINK